MVMPQMVLYTVKFYDLHKKEIEDAAEAWGYKNGGYSSLYNSDVEVVVFERIA